MSNTPTPSARQLRFRAWDPVLKFMMDGDALETCDRIRTGLSYGKLYIAYEKENADWEELIPMQSTGLTDKNGVEIFDGDVLREPTARKLVVVKWAVLSDCCVHGVGFDEVTEYHEVVGNIYEHPLLLS